MKTNNISYMERMAFITFILGILGLIIISVSSVHAEEFTFDLIVVETLAEDERYDCQIHYDDSNRSFHGSREGKRAYDFDKRFKDNVFVNCSRSMDEIRFDIYHDDALVDRQTYKNSFNQSYILNDYDLELKFTSINKSIEIECEVYVDELQLDIDVKHNFKLNEHMLKRFRLDCPTSSNVDVRVYVQGGNPEVTYYDYIENVTHYTYDLETISKDYNIEIQFRDDFNVSNKCTLNLDGETSTSETFTKDDRYKINILEGSAGESMHVKCNHLVEEINVFVDDRRTGKEIFTRKHVNFTEIKSGIKSIIESFVKPTPIVVEVKAPIIEKTVRVIPEVVEQVLVNLTIEPVVINVTQEVIQNVTKLYYPEEIEEIGWLQRFINMFKWWK